MIMGDLDSQDENMREAATALDMPIASIDYRKAPEHPYPAAPEDCYAGVCWVFEQASELGMDTHNIGLMGASAGGGLALAVALMLRDRGGPKLNYLLPIYPMIDDRHETSSSHEVVDLGIWDRAGSIEAWGWYLGDTEPDSYAAPARAEDLSGLPPTYIDVGDLDLFRDEDIVLAQRLSGAGVPVEFHLWTGAYHASELFAPKSASGCTVIAKTARESLAQAKQLLSCFLWTRSQFRVSTRPLLPWVLRAHMSTADFVPSAVARCSLLLTNYRGRSLSRRVVWRTPVGYL
jgi:acetyl esterase/lipase